MRIAHVIDYYQPALGYQEYFLAARQASAGHEVHVVTSDRYMPWQNYEESVQPLLGPRIVGAGVTTSERMTVHRLPVAFEYRRNAIWMRGLHQVLAELHPDVVSVDGVFTLTAGRVARVNRRLGFPLLLDSHVADYNTGSRSLAFRASRVAFRRFMAPAIREQADVLIAIDDGTRAVLARDLGVPPEKVPIIPLGADEHRFRPDPAARAAMRRELGVADDVVIAYAGKLYPQKAVHLLVQSAVLLAREGAGGFQLVIVGRGPADYVRDLRQIATPALDGRFRIVERLLPRDELNDFFNAADIGVWAGEPSNGIQEAMAAGLPLVLPHVNSQGVSSEHYVARSNGLLFTRNSSESLTATLARLLRNSTERSELRHRARCYVEEELSWTRIAERFTEACTAAITTRDTRRRTGAPGPFAARRA